jgi:hypothetical protein
MNEPTSPLSSLRQLIKILCRELDLDLKMTMATILDTRLRSLLDQPVNMLMRVNNEDIFAGWRGAGDQLEMPAFEIRTHGHMGVQIAFCVHRPVDKDGPRFGLVANLDALHPPSEEDEDDPDFT